ncbi:hypothetical protein [Shewanella frigidimarina]|uniref:hypothetical protein n=1 Tax=Shewanella frigidimarina TaxID=56812 RepID=UPI003FA0C602
MSEFVLNIPIVIFSVALGSLISFVGVMISNKSNNERFKAQLLHDERERELERKSSLRKDVYLLAVEELVKANSYLGSLPQADIVNTNIATGIQGFLQSAAKLELVAENDTAEALSELVMGYMQLFLDLTVRVMPINTLHNNIKFNDNLYREAQIEIKRILAEMTQINESGKPDDKKFKMLQNSFEFAQKNSSKLSSENNTSWDNINLQTKEFTNFLMEELAKIQLLQAPLLICIRNELGIATNSTDYQERVVSNAKKAKEMIDKVFVDIETKA